MIDLDTLTISKARAALDTGEFSAVDLARAYLAEIEKKNPTIHAYLEIFDDVIAQAEAADRRIAAGEKGQTAALLGIPLAIKDNILIKDRHASSASKMLENYVASYDATVIEKLKAAGVVFLGRTNMDEFALGGSTENSAFGVTRNPYDESRVSGGTSGGSAAAVAANLCLAALGSDTGGSIRQPASFCGVVGFKPTYGAVSRSGLMAAVSSFDCIGPITKTVEDAEIIFKCIRGQDPLDSTTISTETYTHMNENGLDKKNGKKTIGVLTSLMNQDGIDPTVRENFVEAVQRFRDRGFNVVDIEIPNISYCLSLYYILNFAEVSSNLARFDGVKYGLHVDGKDLLEDYMLSKGEGFGPETRRRILLGTYVLSSGYYDAYYGKAQSAREILKKEFTNAFKNVDFILTPTSPFPAWVIGEKSDPLAAYLADIFTVTANIVGVPAISLPSGFTDSLLENLPKNLPKKLPLGIQLMATHGNEEELFAAGKEFTRTS